LDKTAQAEAQGHEIENGLKQGWEEVDFVGFHENVPVSPPHLPNAVGQFGQPEAIDNAV